MIVNPSVTDLLTKVNNRFELVIATSKRARQLSNGEKPMINSKEESTVTLASIEIEEGLVEVC